MSRGLRGFSRSMEGVWVSEVVFAGRAPRPSRGPGWPLGHPWALALTPARSGACSTTTFEGYLVALFSISVMRLGARTRYPSRVYGRGAAVSLPGHLFADLRSHGAIRPRPDGFKHILGSRQRGAMPLHEPRPVVGERAHAASWLDCRVRMVPSRSP